MKHSVEDFFTGKSVLITGATGFLGKALVEKLLRSCEGLTKIYVLIRTTSHDLSVQDRFSKLLESSVFDHLRRNNPAALKKITPISGDIKLPGVGLTDFDKRLLISTVSIVIHSAATVKFNEEIFDSADLNINGLRKILHLCKQMKNLQAFVHISTAYANCNQAIIDEKLYPPPEGSEELLQYLNGRISRNDQEFYNYLTNTVRRSRPNTYTYTKSVAEYLLSLEADSLPVCIVRPSIVTASLKEPVPGWVDNANGASGVALGIGTGVLRVIKATTDNTHNLVPVDMAANMILCAAFETSVENCNSSTGPNKPIKVYNLCCPQSQTVSMDKFANMCAKIFRNACPLSKAVLYPADLTLTTNTYMHALFDFLFQYVPVAAISMFCTSKESPVRIYRKIKQRAEVVDYFLLNRFTFKTNNVDALYNKLSDKDQKLFQFKVMHIDWDEYWKNYCFGIRRYVIKEEDITIPSAQERMNRLFIWTICYKMLLFISCAILALTIGLKVR